jgi:hypothetical protein
MEDITGKYAWTTIHGEFYQGEYKSLQELAKDLDEDLDRVQVGVYERRVQWEVDAAGILELIGDLTESNCGVLEDSVFEYTPTLDSPEKIAEVEGEIETAIIGILDKHSINYWIIASLNESEQKEWDCIVSEHAGKVRE